MLGFRDSGELFPGISEIDLQLFQVRLDLLDTHFRDSPDSLHGLGIPGNIWFRYNIYIRIACILYIQRNIYIQSADS